MSTTQILHADLTWTGERFESGVTVRVDPEGRITSLDRASAETAHEPDGDTPHRLARRALLPGFVNAHSHAFQRGLRGHGETFPAAAGPASKPDRRNPDSFWSWREAMYDLVANVDAESFLELCRRAFREMLAAGITTVGEFHYLHHLDTACGYDLDALVLRAAKETGIRIALLQACYMTGGIQQPLRGAQRRFACDDLDAYWRQLDRLSEILDPTTQSLGVVGHSIRAVSPADLEDLYAGALERGLPFHMHLEEQRREIEDCVKVYGRTPMALILERLDISPRFTAVHCTHTRADDMAEFLEAGGRVCICPLTEANLGDGIADLPGILRKGGRVCLGTDSNARIAMVEEMRWLEYVQRLRHERRGVVRDGEGQVGRRLLRAATRDGAKSLGVDAGEIAIGKHADLVTLDLDAPCLAGATPETLLDAFVCGGDAAIRDVMVGGRWVT